MLESFGDVAPHDALGESFDDRGFPDARLADEHRVVLRAPRQDLDHTADLFVTADHRIQLVLAGIVGQVASVALECLVFPLGVLVGDPLGPADRGERFENPVPGDGVSFQKCGARKAITLVSERDEEVLRADVLVLEVLGFSLRHARHRRQPRGDTRLGAAIRVRTLFKLGLQILRDAGGVDPHLTQDVRDDPVTLFDERREQMFGLELWMAHLLGEPLRAEDRVLRLLRVAVEVHVSWIRLPNSSSPTPVWRGPRSVAVALSSGERASAH